MPADQASDDSAGESRTDLRAILVPTRSRIIDRDVITESSVHTDGVQNNFVVYGVGAPSQLKL